MRVGGTRQIECAGVWEGERERDGGIGFRDGAHHPRAAACRRSPGASAEKSHDLLDLQAEPAGNGVRCGETREWEQQQQQQQQQP